MYFKLLIIVAVCDGDNNFGWASDIDLCLQMVCDSFTIVVECNSVDSKESIQSGTSSVADIDGETSGSSSDSQ